MSTAILSYRFSGEVIAELSPVLENIQKKLENIWFSDVFCSLFLEEFFNEKWLSIQERYDYCIQEQEKKDFMIAFIRNEFQSTGMKWELEKAKEHRQTILLLIKEGIEEHHPEFIQHAHHTIKFQTIEWLYDTLNRLDLEAMIHSRNNKQ